MKILLAEDDTNISTIAKMALEHMGGHKVDVATDGEEALEMAMDSKYDLIILDEMMPKMSGVKVCEEYFGQCTSPVPVIFMSANSQSSTIEVFERLGTGFIPKPFDPQFICEQINRILGLKDQSAA